MKKLNVSQATNSLAQFARELDKEPLVLSEGGHAIAALAPFDDADVESMALCRNADFNGLIERARAEHRNGASLSAEEARRELGVS
jgi:hypothetical protein